MANKKEKFIIIDGNALIHRSFHALPPLTTKSGLMINAAYGFTSVLLKAIKDIKPTYIALTLDRKEKTFRHEEYKEYKATRIKAPDELYAQIPLVKEIANVFNIPIFEKPGFEADDLIGTLANSVDGKVEKIIVTGDMDTLQLVNKDTKVYAMSRGITDAVLYDDEAVIARYGLKPEQMIDYKSLRGDPSDNIPGVKGIGEKTAIELLQKFGKLEKIYEHIDSAKDQTEIKERIFNLLVEHKDDAFMSKRLATIDLNVDIDFKLADAKFGNFDVDQAAQLFTKLEFKSLLTRLQSLCLNKKEVGDNLDEDGRTTDKFERNKKLFKYILVDDEKEFEKFYKKLKEQKNFTFDTETATCGPVFAELLGVSFSWKEGEAYYLNFQDTRNNNQKESKIQNSPRPKLGTMAKSKIAGLFDNVDDFKKNSVNKNIEWFDKLKPIFEDEKINKYGHNIKYDIEVMASYDIDVKGAAADSMIMSYLLNPGSRQHNLDTVVFTELGFQKISKEDLLGKGREKIIFNEIPLEKLYNYSCEDADFTNRLVKKLLPALKKEKLEKLFDEMEMPLVMVLANMEMNGISVDKEYLLKLKKRVVKEIENLEKKIHDMVGSDFNINSTQQLREVLFETLEIPTAGISRTKTGLSTGADELEKMKSLHPIIELIQKYRELSKLMNTYIDALPEMINDNTGRLHTCFNQSVTATGRLSSTDPNLQNIPIRTDLGKEIRRSFVACEGCKLLSLDYSQIELRLAAHMSGDKNMIKAFLDGEDIHRATAAAINQVEPEKVTSQMRREAKAVNFGILYGQGPHGLSQGADIPYARAKDFIDQYFVVYKGVKEFVDSCIEQARLKGYAETLFGRKRYLPEMNSSVMQIRKGAERMAINTPLQGTAADMIKAAMVKIYNEVNLKYKKEEVKMLLQVHDELLFEVKNELVEKCVKEFKDAMENVIKLKVPVIVDAKAGDNWEEMTKIKK